MPCSSALGAWRKGLEPKTLDAGGAQDLRALTCLREQKTQAARRSGGGAQTAVVERAMEIMATTTQQGGRASGQQTITMLDVVDEGHGRRTRREDQDRCAMAAGRGRR